MPHCYLKGRTWQRVSFSQVLKRLQWWSRISTHPPLSVHYLWGAWIFITSDAFTKISPKIRWVGEDINVTLSERVTNPHPTQPQRLITLSVFQTLMNSIFCNLGTMTSLPHQYFYLLLSCTCLAVRTHHITISEIICIGTSLFPGLVLLENTDEGQSSQVSIDEKPET